MLNSEQGALAHLTTHQDRTSTNQARHISV